MRRKFEEGGRGGGRGKEDEEKRRCAGREIKWRREKTGEKYEEGNSKGRVSKMKEMENRENGRGKRKGEE